jgi:hypothetical protein
MPTYGNPGKESFERAVIHIRNQHIVAGLAPLMVMRQECVTNDEFQNRQGIDNVTRDHFIRLLISADRVRRRITYNPDNVNLGDAIARAINTNNVIDKGTNAAGGDEIQAQSGRLFAIPYALDGSDPNVPLPSVLEMTSPVGVLLLSGIDVSIVTWTRLESAQRTKFITPEDSLRVYGTYQQILTFLQDFGGDANRVDVANLLPTREPLGPQSSPNRVGEIGGTPTAPSA